MSGEKCGPVPVQVPTVKSLQGHLLFCHQVSWLDTEVCLGKAGHPGRTDAEGSRRGCVRILGQTRTPPCWARLSHARAAPCPRVLELAPPWVWSPSCGSGQSRPGWSGMGAWVLRGQGLNSEMLSPSASRPPPGLGLV